MSEPASDYTTCEKASYSDVVLPTVNHAAFLTDKAAQHALLALLFEKLAIEHRTSNHALFLEFDTERRGVLTPSEFRSALDRLGVPLTDDQLTWLVGAFDCDRDGTIDFGEFLKALDSMRAGKVAAGGPGAASVSTKTGLEWAHEPQASPFKAADDAREARKRVVLQRYVDMLHQAASAAVKEGATATTTGTQTEAAEEEAVVQAVLVRLAGVVYDKLGGIRRAFAHVDGDGDHAVSKADLAHCLEHHLGLVLPDQEFEVLFETLDFEGKGAIEYHEWIRVMAKYAEATEGGAKPHAWTPSAALVATPAKPNTKPTEAAASMEQVVDETAGLGVEDPVRKEDDAALRQAAEALHEKGLHAHNLIKQLLPDSGGKVDAQGLLALMGKLGVAVDEARAQRFMARADLMGQGAIVSWELVRLLSSAAPKEE